MFEALLVSLEKLDLLPTDEVINIGYGDSPPVASFQVIDVDPRRTLAQPPVDEE